MKCLPFRILSIFFWAITISCSELFEISGDITVYQQFNKDYLLIAELSEVSSGLWYLTPKIPMAHGPCLTCESSHYVALQGVLKPQVQPLPACEGMRRAASGHFELGSVHFGVSKWSTSTRLTMKNIRVLESFGILPCSHDSW